MTIADMANVVDMAHAYAQTPEYPAASPSLRPWALFAAAMAVAMAAVGLRTPIVKLVPQAAGFYGRVGLPVNVVGLDIARVTARIVPDGARRILVVEGEVANTSSAPHLIPAMQVSILGGEGPPLYVWSTKPLRQNLAPGEHAAFSARLASPPAEGAEVKVEFDRTIPASATARK